MLTELKWKRNGDVYSSTKGTSTHLWDSHHWIGIRSNPRRKSVNPFIDKPGRQFQRKGIYLPIEKKSLSYRVQWKIMGKTPRKIETEFWRIGGISLDEFPIDLVGDKSLNLAKAKHRSINNNGGDLMAADFNSCQYLSLKCGPLEYCTWT